jgi:hypothetical protein
MVDSWVLKKWLQYLLVNEKLSKSLIERGSRIRRIISVGSRSCSAMAALFDGGGINSRESESV